MLIYMSSTHIAREMSKRDKCFSYQTKDFETTNAEDTKNCPNVEQLFVSCDLPPRGIPLRVQLIYSQTQQNSPPMSYVPSFSGRTRTTRMRDARCSGPTPISIVNWSSSFSSKVVRRPTP